MDVIVRLVVLAVRDLVTGRRAWVALVVSVLGMGVVFALLLGLVIVGAGTSGEAQDAFAAVGGVALGFSVLTGVVNLSQVARVSVFLRRRPMAQWQVAGVLPRQAFAVVWAQVILVCVLGGVVAAMLAPVMWVPFSEFVRGAGLPSAPGLSGPIPITATAWAAATSVLVGSIGGLRAARLSARPDVLSALQGVQEPSGRRQQWATLLRGMAVVLLCVGVGALYWAISRVPVRTEDELGDFLTVYPGMGMLLLVVIALAAGPLVTGLTRTVARLVPVRDATLGGYLASRQAASRVDHTRGLVMPVALATAVIGVVLSWTVTLGRTLQQSGGGEVRAPAAQLALLLGGPVAIAVFSSVSVSYATLDTRIRDAALLTAMGTRPVTLYRQVVAEAWLYSLMSAIIGYGVIVVNDRVIHVALAHGPVPDIATGTIPWEPLLATACAFVLHCVILLSISGYAIRQDPVLSIARNLR